MAKSKAANVITIIFAAILSILLVVLCVATPVYMSLTALVKPDKMTQIANKVGQALIQSEKEGTSPEFSSFLDDKIYLEPTIDLSQLTDAELSGLTKEDLSQFSQEDLSKLPEDVLSKLPEGTLPEGTTNGEVPKLPEGGLPEDATDSEVTVMVEEYMEKLKEVVSGEAIVKTVLAEFNLPETAVNDLMDSKPAQQMIMTYAEDVSKFLVEGSVESSLTEDKVKEILNEHIDEVVEIAKQSHEINLSDEEIKTKIQGAIETNAKEIAEAVPPIEQISSVVSEDVQTTVRVFTNPKITVVLIVICAVLAVLIFVCRMRKFGGFLWLGIDVGVATLLLLAIYVILSKTHGLIQNTALNILVGATVSVYMETVLLGMILLASLTVFFLALFFVLKFTVVKKRELKAAAAE